MEPSSRVLVDLRAALVAERDAVARNPDRLVQQLLPRVEALGDSPAVPVLRAVAERRQVIADAPSAWLWRVTPPTTPAVPRTTLPLDADVVDLRHSPDGSRIAVALTDGDRSDWAGGRLLVVATGSGRIEREIVTARPPVAIGWVSGHLVAIAASDGGVEVRSADTGARVAAREVDGTVTSLGTASAADLVAIGVADGGVVLWDLADGSSVALPPDDEGRHRDGEVTLDAGGRTCVVAERRTMTKRIVVVDVESRRDVHVLSAPVARTGAVLEPDGAYLAVASDCGEVILRGAARLAGSLADRPLRYPRTGVLVEHTPVPGGMMSFPYTSRVQSVPVVALAATRPSPAWPQGALATGGSDGRVVVLDPVSAAVPVDADRHPATVVALGFADDGTLVSAGGDGTVCATTPDGSGGPSARVPEALGPPVALAALGRGVLVATRRGALLHWDCTWAPPSVVAPDLGDVADVAVVGVGPEAAVVTVGGTGVRWGTVRDGGLVEGWADPRPAQVVVACGDVALVGCGPVGLRAAHDGIAEEGRFGEATRVVDITATEDGAVAVVLVHAPDGVDGLVIDRARGASHPLGSGEDPSLSSIRVADTAAAAVAAARDELVVWDLSSGGLLARVPTAGSGYRATRTFGRRSFRAAATSADARVLAGLAADGALGTTVDVEVVDRVSGTRRTVEGWSATHLDLSPDGTTLATAARDLHLWSVDELPSAVRAGHDDVVTSVRVVGQRGAGECLSLSRDRTIRRWDVETGEPLGVLSGHGDAVVDLAFARDPHQVITASMDGSAARWDLGTGRLLTSHPCGAPVLACGLTDDDTVLTVAEDGLTTWTEAGQVVRRAGLPGVRWAWASDLPGRQPCVIELADRLIAVDPGTFEVTWEWQVDGRRLGVDRTMGSTVWASEGVLAVVGGGFAMARRPNVDRVALATSARPLVAAGGALGIVAWADDDGDVWRAQTLTGQVERLGRHEGAPTGCILDPVGQTVVVTSDHAISVWPDGGRPGGIDVESRVATARFFPGEPRLVVGCWDGSVHLFDVRGVT